MSLNADGKFLDRLIPSLISAALAVTVAIGGQALGFWSDSKAIDKAALASIERLDKEIAEMKVEQRAARMGADLDRQKLAELSADMRNVSRSTARIEGLLDRVLMPTPPRNP